jgi:DNA repair exonuclease SbcCD ATPase subunit
VKQLKAKIAELTQKIENPPDTSDIDADNTLWKKRKDSISTVKVEIGVATSKMQDIDRRVESTKRSRPHLQECPSCRASLMVTPGGTSIKEFDVQAHETHVQGLVESLLSEKEVLQRRIDKISPLLSRESEVDAALQQCSDRRSQRLSEISGLVGDRSIAEFQLEAHTKAVKSYQAAVVQRKKISDQEVELTTQRATLETKLSSLQDDLILWSAVKSVFSPTGFIAYSLEDVIADINTAAAAYLDILSQGTATYNLSSSTSDGKAKISHQIVVNGSEVSIGSLSGGEERGVVLAVDFGIADVLVQKANAQLPSLMLLDECLEGLDAVGKEKVLDALKEISRERCIMVIDHSTEFSSLFDQVITVTKKDDISKVEI